MTNLFNNLTFETAIYQIPNCKLTVTKVNEQITETDEYGQVQHYTFSGSIAEFMKDTYKNAKQIA